MAILGVTPHARKAGWMTVAFRDSEGAEQTVLVTDEAAYKLGLREGGEVAGVALAKAVERGQAWDLATGALMRRMMSGRQVADLLNRKGIGPEVSAEVVAKLTSSGIVDDARFAQQLVNRRLSRGSSVWALRLELKRKGIAREDADAAIGHIAGEILVDPVEAAQREGARKIRALAKQPADVARRRLVAYLRRRGHSGDAVRQVVPQLMRGRTE